MVERGWLVTQPPEAQPDTQERLAALGDASSGA